MARCGQVVHRNRQGQLSMPRKLRCVDKRVHSNPDRGTEGLRSLPPTSSAFTPSFPSASLILSAPCCVTGGGLELL